MNTMEGRGVRRGDEMSMPTRDLIMIRYNRMTTCRAQAIEAEGELF